MRPLLTLNVLSVLILIGCEQPQSRPTGTSAGEPTEPAKPPAIVSPWKVSTSTNELNGVKSITATNGFGEEAIIVRLIGKKLECYVTTGTFLETIDNLDSRRTLVKYKFDNGGIVQQSWIISDDNTALFYPGNPMAFIKNMRKAKRFVIEYSPAHLVPQTASFDVSLFPSEIPDQPEAHKPAKAEDPTPQAHR